MARRLGTVDDLITQVRGKIDEDNIESVSDEFILDALNRGQDDGMNILARHFEEPLLTHQPLDLVNGQQEYDIPEEAFEDRLEKVEINIRGTFVEVQRIDYHDISYFETRTKADVPYYYALVGRKMRLVPDVSGTYDARIWYLRAPEELVKQQGRITVISSSPDNYVVVDQAGDNLDTATDALESYVNVIDGQTGIVKGTLQISNIEGDRVKFKSTPTRATVFNRTVDSDINNLSSGLTVELDDYICSAQGTCVPQFARPMSNFLVQFADAEARMKLGGPADMSLRILEKFEKERVERAWVGRQQHRRVKKRSKHWDLPHRRWYFSRGGE